MLRVTLTRLVKGPKKTANVDDMIGFYILKATEPNGEIKGDLRRAVVFETTFVTTPENTAEKDLLVGSGSGAVVGWTGRWWGLAAGRWLDGLPNACPRMSQTSSTCFTAFAHCHGPVLILSSSHVGQHCLHLDTHHVFARQDGQVHSGRDMQSRL